MPHKVKYLFQILATQNKNTQRNMQIYYSSENELFILDILCIIFGEARNTFAKI